MKAVNATVISLDDAPEGYKSFDKGVAEKFVLDPHDPGTLAVPDKPEGFQEVARNRSWALYERGCARD